MVRFEARSVNPSDQPIVTPAAALIDGREDARAFTSPFGFTGDEMRPAAARTFRVGAVTRWSPRRCSRARTYVHQPLRILR
jgi:hypothetical protein